MVQWMGIINLTPDSFYESSRVAPSAEAFLSRARVFLEAGASIIDVGAVSTRPGASEVALETEWERLAPALEAFCGSGLREQGLKLSIDTTSAEIVRRSFRLVGSFIVNDISAGEDDPQMLPAVAELGLPYVAMHKRGNPRTMDSRTDYPGGVVGELLRYFEAFGRRTEELGIGEWILDPGLGFAKTPAQNWEILEGLQAFRRFGRPVLIGAADKRFTREVPMHIASRYPGCASGTEVAHKLAADNGADILRVHEIPK